MSRTFDEVCGETLGMCRDTFLADMPNVKKSTPKKQLNKTVEEICQRLDEAACKYDRLPD